MPPKRKAGTSGAPGSTKAGKNSALSTPGPATPRSLDSSMMSDADDDVEEDITEEQRNKEEEYAKEADQFVNNWEITSSRFQQRAKGAHRDAASAYFGKRDFSYLLLKPDHQNRPIWIDPERGVIVLERFNTLSEQATDFLITIAEPKSRPTFLHEYALTTHSSLCCCVRWTSSHRHYQHAGPVLKDADP